MPTVTPTYNWPVPVSTDLVKDGAVAISDLGDAADATVASLGQGVKRYLISTGSAITLTTTTETALFSAASFTPELGRLYEITYVVGQVTKTTATGNVIIRVRKNSTAGAQVSAGVLIAPTIGIGMSFTKVVVADLGSTSFTPVVTIQASNNGATAATTSFDGGILIKDIGPA